MCGTKGSAPTPSGASTTTAGTSSGMAIGEFAQGPTPETGARYEAFLNKVGGLAQTPFDPAMQGRVAPLNRMQRTGIKSLYDAGLNMGEFDPTEISAIMSPFTQNVVDTTQDWFNNQNAIQANDLLGQGIRSGNAFGGDRYGVGAAQMAGQQQLAQAPVIANLYEDSYNRAVQEYNLLKQYALTGSEAAIKAGTIPQAQRQRVLDTEQQNAMMRNAYPFQLANWEGAALGGIGPLTGTKGASTTSTTASTTGVTNPPTPSPLATALGLGSGLIGVANALPAGTFGTGTTVKDGGAIGRLKNGGDPSSGELEPEEDFESFGQQLGVKSAKDEGVPNITGKFEFPRLKQQYARPQQGYMPTPTSESRPSSGSSGSSSSSGSLLSTGSDILKAGAGIASIAGFLSDPKTKTDVQRVGKTDAGEPLYGFRYKGDPKTYPKVVGPMARPKHMQEGGTAERSEITLPWDRGGTNPWDYDPRAPDPAEEFLFRKGAFEGPAGGSQGGTPVQGVDMPNVARARAPYYGELYNNPNVARAFDVNTVKEVGTDADRQATYRAAVLNRAAATGRSLEDTIDNPYDPVRKTGYYPPATAIPTARALETTGPYTGKGVPPSLWTGDDPAGFGTGNASFDPKTGKWVSFGGGPQTATVGSGGNTELVGIEKADLPWARAMGYTGPDWTAIGPGERRPGSGAYSAYAAADDSAAGGPRAYGPMSVQNIPGLGPPPKTFAQRWASNPFTQMSIGLLSNTGPYPGPAIARGMELATGALERERAQDVLDARPQMITSGPTVMARSGDRLIDFGIPTQTAAQEAAEKRRLDREKRLGTTGGAPSKTADTARDNLIYRREASIYKTLAVDPRWTGKPDEEIRYEAKRRAIEDWNSMHPDRKIEVPSPPAKTATTGPADEGVVKKPKWWQGAPGAFEANPLNVPPPRPSLVPVPAGPGAQGTIARPNLGAPATETATPKPSVGPPAATAEPAPAEPAPASKSFKQSIEGMTHDQVREFARTQLSGIRTRAKRQEIFKRLKDSGIPYQDLMTPDDAGARVPPSS